MRKIINSEIDKVIMLHNNGSPIEFKVGDWIQEDTDWYLRQLGKIRPHFCAISSSENF